MNTIEEKKLINFETAKQILADVRKELNKQELKEPLTIYSALNATFKVESRVHRDFRVQQEILQNKLKN